MLDYPGYGNPCNGCGLCCIAEPCQLSRDLFGDVGHCPALEQQGERYVCGLITDPGAYNAIPQDYLDTQGRWPRFDATATAQKYYASLLGAGRGCDAGIKENAP